MIRKNLASVGDNLLKGLRFRQVPDLIAAYYCGDRSDGRGWSTRGTPGAARSTTSGPMLGTTATSF